MQILSTSGNTLAVDNVGAANSVCEEIYEAIRSLVSLPYLGHSRSDLTAHPLRFHLVREYLIAYAPDEQPLVIIAVVHGRRSPRVIARLLRGRE
jgi:antitoxin ParD1/3/4/toxin ParE1/3/4